MEKLAQRIIDNLPEALYAINTNGEVVIWNKQIEAITGVKKEDILGKGNYEYSNVFYSERIPALIDTLLDKTGEIEKNFINFQRNGNMVYGERKLKQVNKYLQSWASIIQGDDDNMFLGEYVIIRDITEFKEHEVNFLKIFQEIPVATAVVDYDTGEFIKVNRFFQEFTGYTLDTLEKEKITAFDYIKDFDGQYIVNKLKDECVTKHLDIIITMKSGDIKYGILSCSIITSYESKKSIILIVEDITKQKLLEEYLNKIKEKSDLKIKEYIETQNKKFDEIMNKHQKEIKESLNISQNIIKTLTLNGNGGKHK